MKKNVGTIDRAARIVVALALLVLAAIVGFSGAGSVVVSVVAIALAVILAVTGLVGSCPIYTALHRNTLHKTLSH